MFELLKIIHFIGFVIGIGGGMANGIAGAQLLAGPPEALPLVGQFRATLAKVSHIGLALLWLTGGAMIWLRHDASLWREPLFAAKIAFVVVLTAAAIVGNMTIRAAQKAGIPPDNDRLDKIGKVAGVTGFAALALAILAFG